MTVYKLREDLKVELVAYSAAKGYIQVRINGTIYEYNIQGNVEQVVKRVQTHLKLAGHSAALQELISYKVKGSKTKVDYLDKLTDGDETC